MAAIRRVRWDIVVVVLFLLPIAVTVLAILVRFALWAVTGDGSWAGWTPFEERGQG